MHNARAFFCAGIVLLAAVLPSRSAERGGAGTRQSVAAPWRPENPLTRVGNFWDGGVAPVQQESWGSVRPAIAALPCRKTDRH